jgi:hypothetical protein
MKVTLRREEIKAVLTSYFGIEVEEFVIGSSEPSEIGRMARSAVNRPLDPMVKISNIRTIRALSFTLQKPMTLQEANWAITHWLEWIGFVDEYNRLPMPGYGHFKTFGKLE